MDCFTTEEDAHVFIQGFSIENRAVCKIVPVDCEGNWATIAILKKAGLGDLLGDMEADVLRFAEPMGSA